MATGCLPGVFPNDPEKKDSLWMGLPPQLESAALDNSVSVIQNLPLHIKHCIYFDLYVQ